MYTINCIVSCYAEDRKYEYICVIRTLINFEEVITLENKEGSVSKLQMVVTIEILLLTLNERVCV